MVMRSQGRHALTQMMITAGTLEGTYRLRGRRAAFQKHTRKRSTGYAISSVSMFARTKEGRRERYPVLDVAPCPYGGIYGYSYRSGARLPLQKEIRTLHEQNSPLKISTRKWRPGSRCNTLHQWRRCWDRCLLSRALGQLSLLVLRNATRSAKPVSAMRYYFFSPCVTFSHMCDASAACMSRSGGAPG